jgi:hypothetical protein
MQKQESFKEIRALRQRSNERINRLLTRFYTLEGVLRTSAEEDRVRTLNAAMDDKIRDRTGFENPVGKNLLESVLLVLERAAYKSGLPPSLPPYRNLGSDALFSCDICLYIPVDSTLLHSSVAIECKLSSSALQIPTNPPRTVLAWVARATEAEHFLAKTKKRRKENQGQGQSKDQTPGNPHGSKSDSSGKRNTGRGDATSCRKQKEA